MHLSDAQLSALLGPLNTSRVQSRQQGGATLQYLEAWDVKATLIRVFGFGGFSAEVTEVDVFSTEQGPPVKYSDRRTGEEKERPGNWTVAARVTVRLTIHATDGGRDAIYTETAASSQTNPQIGEAADFAIKTAESDALKRAAIYLGTQFGLSLYDDGKTTDVVKVVLADDQRWPKPEEKGEGGEAEKKADPVAKAEADIARATAAAAERRAAREG